MKKIIFLVFILAIPASIFLFLKYFGTNSFVVPILFEQGIPWCEGDSQPHVVPNVQYVGKDNRLFQTHDLEGFIVYGFLDASDVDQYNKIIVGLIQIQDSFYESGAPHFLLFVLGDMQERVAMEALFNEKGLDEKICSVAYLEKEKLIGFMKCGIGFADTDVSSNLVMTDSKGRIRGIYYIQEQEGTDQLILELQILNKEQRNE